jgi:hypothetical protein
MKQWTELRAFRDTLRFAVGKTVARRVTARAELPDAASYNRLSQDCYDDFEAVAFTDGTWLAIESSEGAPYYSEYTPGEPVSVSTFVYDEVLVLSEPRGTITITPDGLSVSL